LARRQERW